MPPPELETVYTDKLGSDAPSQKEKSISHPITGEYCWIKSSPGQVSINLGYYKARWDNTNKKFPGDFGGDFILAEFNCNKKGEFMGSDGIPKNPTKIFLDAILTHVDLAAYNNIVVPILIQCRQAVSQAAPGAFEYK